MRYRQPTNGHNLTGIADHPPGCLGRTRGSGNPFHGWDASGVWRWPPATLPACFLPAFLLKMYHLKTPWLVAVAVSFLGLRPCLLSWGSGNISSTKIKRR